MTLTVDHLGHFHWETEFLDICRNSAVDTPPLKYTGLEGDSVPY